jgi:hypothetical protein
MRNDSMGSVEGIGPVINKDNMDPSNDQACQTESACMAVSKIVLSKIDED